MQGPVRGILAGLAAWKLGGGLISLSSFSYSGCLENAKKRKMDNGK